MSFFLPLFNLLKEVRQRASSRKSTLYVYVSLSVKSSSATPRAIAHKSRLSMEFSRQECWSRLPFPSPGIKPGSPAWQVDSIPSESPGKPRRSITTSCCCCFVASVGSDFVQHCGLQPARLLCPWDSRGKNTGVDCHALLRGSSRPRDWTQVSCIAGRFFTAEPPGELTTTRDIYKEYGLDVVKGNSAKACVPLFLSGPENICLPNVCFF